MMILVHEAIDKPLGAMHRGQEPGSAQMRNTAMTYALYAKSRFGGTIICLAVSDDMQIIKNHEAAWRAAHGKWWTYTLDTWEYQA